MLLVWVSILLTDAIGTSCRVAICFSGHVRSFMHAHVRERTRERLVKQLNCETVDVFFYLALEEPRGLAIRRAWDNFNRPSTVTPDAVRAAALEFNPTAVVLHHDDTRHTPQDCRDGRALPDAFFQLYKTAACFGLIESAEAVQSAYHSPTNNMRYDWVVRARPDLAWAAPITSINAFQNDRVYLPGHFWPIGDMFALVPRHLARIYFRAVDSFYNCNTLCSKAQQPYLTNAIARSLLYFNLAFELNRMRRLVCRRVSSTSTSQNGVSQSKFTMALPLRLRDTLKVSLPPPIFPPYFHASKVPTASRFICCITMPAFFWLLMT